MENKLPYAGQSSFLVAVDCVIFGYENDELKLLLWPRKIAPSAGKWSLMGGFMLENESLELAAARVLKSTVGLEDIFMKQVGGFSEVERDPGGRVISMAYYALIRINEYNSDLVKQHGGKWWNITQLPEMIFDHGDMVALALKKLRYKATFKLMGKELLPELFTLTQLNNLYNAIFQRTFDPGNFRKKLMSLDILEKMAIKETQSSKRGAYYFKFKDNIDDSQYDRIVKV